MSVAHLLDSCTVSQHLAPGAAAKDKGHFKDVLKEIEDDLATDDDDDE